MHVHNTRAIKVLVIALSTDMACGLVFALTEHLAVVTGLYWAITTATTVGYGDVTPNSWLGHFIAVIVMLTVIPLFAAAFSLMTSGLTSLQVSDSEERLKAHFEDRLRHHLRKERNGNDSLSSNQLEPYGDTASHSE